MGLNVKLEFLGGLIIGALMSQILPAWKILTDKNRTNPRIFPCPCKPTFNAGITHNRNRYQKGSVNINFLSEYTGKLKNGFFINEIVFAENADHNKFPQNLPFLYENDSVARLPCLDTIDNIEGKKGRLNGCREYRFTWPLDTQYQNDLPRGKYKVKCMVFNENEDNPLLFKESVFEVIESSSSNKPLNYHTDPNFKFG
jgi:hypothetical protein